MAVCTIGGSSCDITNLILSAFASTKAFDLCCSEVFKAHQRCASHVFFNELNRSVSVWPLCN